MFITILMLKHSHNNNISSPHPRETKIHNKKKELRDSSLFPTPSTWSRIFIVTKLFPRPHRLYTFMALTKFILVFFSFLSPIVLVPTIVLLRITTMLSNSEF